MSMLDMYDTAEELGYYGRYILFWKQYGRRFSVKNLRTYSDIIDMLTSMTKNRQINFYLEEEVTEVRIETEDATRDVTEEATVDVPGGATGDVTEEATIDVPGDATEEACGDATSDLHEEATVDVTGDAIEEASGGATGDDVTGEAYDVEVGDCCSEEDSDYVVDDVEEEDSGSEDYDSGFEDSENSGSEHEGYVHDVNVNNDFEMGLKNDLLGGCHIRVNDDDVNEGEELHSASESDSDDQKKKVKFPEFNTEADMVNPQFQKGMVFSGKEIFKAAVREYGIKNRVDLKLKRIDSKRVHVICKEGCPWYMWASRVDPKDRINPTWHIKSYNREHKCMMALQNKNVTYKWLAKTYLEKYRDDPTYSSRQLKKDVMHDLVYKVSASKCLRARNLALEMVMGSHKGYFGGTFLATVGVDANDNIYLIVYAVVEAESQSSWDWFMSLLVVDLEIEKAMTQVFPSAEHRTCVRHLYSNFKNREKFKGKNLKDLLWKATRATYLKEFEDAMAELKAVSIQAFVWLSGNDPRQWSKSHFSPFCNFCKSDMLLSNLSEYFNKARDKPILTLMEMRPESYVDHCYHITTQQEIYSHFITPMRGPNQWVEDTTCEAVLEPKLRRPPGRPKKKRVKEADEPVNSISSNVRFTKKGLTIYYSKCGKAGHNQRTCKGEVGANMSVNAAKRKENQQSDTSVRLPKLQRPTASPSETSPFVFIPIPGLASHPTTQQICPTQQPGSVMTVRLMPTSQEHCSVDQSLSQSSTLTQNVQENNNNEGLRKRPRMV
ncbi:hypothetical protein GQ457_17G007000 [Hibiscus cannabinus]